MILNVSLHFACMIIMSRIVGKRVFFTDCMYSCPTYILYIYRYFLQRKCSICDGLGILQNFSPDELTFEKSSSNSVASRSCPHCNSGRRECTDCHGKGRITCVTCQGEGALKISIRLAVKWLGKLLFWLFE